VSPFSKTAGSEVVGIIESTAQKVGGYSYTTTTIKIIKVAKSHLYLLELIYKYLSI